MFAYSVPNFLLMMLLSTCAIPVEDVQWWTTHSLVKVRPQDRPQKQQSIHLFAARNEFESFQIVLRTTGPDVPGIDVLVGDLFSAEKAKIDKKHVTIYRQHYLNLASASSAEGGSGEWPDPLLPRVDRYFGERRNAFPFHLKSGRNQPIWIEIYVPSTTPPGTYSGQVELVADEEGFGSVPIEITVWPFTLPSTSSLKTSFGLSGKLAVKQHHGPHGITEESMIEFTRLYSKAALLHRLSVHGGTLSAPPFKRRDGQMEIDWTLYDREVEAFLDGTVFKEDDPLPGARFTTIDLRTHPEADTPEKKVLYWREWVKHFQKKGWMDRLFHYLWDEPRPEDYSKVVEKGKLVHRADPRLRNLLTEQFVPTLAEVVDIWTPLVNCLELKPGFGSFCEETPAYEVYRKEMERGKSLWFYQSCGSHGCNMKGGEYFSGWPSYAIDIDSAVAHRIQEWVSWKYDIQGELYFNLVEAYQRTDPDPWEDVFLFGGNGDGTLLYPGNPKRIGGRRHIPIESIRLKLIRDGLEDYEYFVMLAEAGLSAFADQQVDRIVQTTYRWDRDPELLLEVRKALGQRLSEIPQP